MTDDLIKRADELGVGSSVRRLLGCDFGTKLWVGAENERPAGPSPCDMTATKRIILHVEDGREFHVQFCAVHAGIVEEWSTRSET